MTAVFHRQLRSPVPVAVRSEGVHFYDREGRRYLDASGGAAVSCLGHGDQDVIAAIVRQLERMAYAHTSFFTSEPAEELAHALAMRAPGTLRHAYFLSGGSEAVEASLKLARQYFLERGEPDRRHIIARRQSFHGNTLGALSVGGNQWRRAPFEPLLTPVTHVSPCYAYRGQRPDETEEAYGQRVADELEEAIERLGPGTVAAFVAEPVVGATLGAVPPVKGYFRRIREICDRHGVLLIFDEVMCGMGRTGTLFACEQEGIAPDLLVVAKGLGAGYQPISALLASDEVYQTIRGGSGAFQHGHTYMAHAAACAAGLAVLGAIENRGLLANVREQGVALKLALGERLGDHPAVGDIRGRGLFVGIELVADRATKRPFPPGMRLHARVREEAFARGLLCYPMGGTVDGTLGDHVLLAPPFIVGAEEVRDIARGIGDALDAAVAGIDR